VIIPPPRAIVAFTRSSQSLVKKNSRKWRSTRPIWTPLIPPPSQKTRSWTFDKQVPMGRPGQPEIAPSYVFLASDDASYMAGQILHPNGGAVVNG